MFIIQMLINLSGLGWITTESKLLRKTYTRLNHLLKIAQLIARKQLKSTFHAFS